MRIVWAAVLMLALNLTATDTALAQKNPARTSSTSPAAPPAPQSSEPEAYTPDDIEDMLDMADAAMSLPTPVYELAFTLYSEAAALGSAYGMYRTAMMYEQGQHVAQDAAKALEWYRKAAEAGLPVAQTYLGSLYLLGEGGVEKNPAEALRWIHRAADGGYTLAMHLLGSLYLGGNGVAKDPEEAVAWLTKASDGGYVDAHWALALRYLYGQGVGKDSHKAADLAYLALTKGSQQALDELQDIRQSVSSPNFRRALQDLLKRDGFYSGAIDGDFGPGTQKAIDAAFNSVP